MNRTRLRWVAFLVLLSIAPLGSAHAAEIVRRSDVPSAALVRRRVAEVKAALLKSDDLRKPKYRGAANPMTGHCYVASEALYHLLGGKNAGWVPQSVHHEGEPHWYLKNRLTGQIVDPTAEQFKTPVPVEQGRGTGFLTRQPSKRAQELMRRMGEAAPSN